MRIDKYLWCVRLYKTRTDASEAIRLGRIQVNGQPVKPAREVVPGDVVSVRRVAINLTLRIKQLPKGRLGAKLVAEYVEDCTPQAELDKMRMRLMQQTLSRAPGTGRPTKKERRDIEEMLQVESPESSEPLDDELDADELLALEDDEALYELLHGHDA